MLLIYLCFFIALIWCCCATATGDCIDNFPGNTCTVVIQNLTRYDDPLGNSCTETDCDNGEGTYVLNWNGITPTVPSPYWTYVLSIGTTECAVRQITVNAGGSGTTCAVGCQVFGTRGGIENNFVLPGPNPTSDDEYTSDPCIPLRIFSQPSLTTGRPSCFGGDGSTLVVTMEFSCD